MANYTLIDAGLQQGSFGITSLHDDIYKPEYEDTLSTCLQYELIFSTVFICLCCIVVAIIHGLYLSPILTECNKSLNMIRILPAWIFQRNPKANLLISLWSIHNSFLKIYNVNIIYYLFWDYLCQFQESKNPRLIKF